jgi:cell division septum initiation protein DivIVA
MIFSKAWRLQRLEYKIAGLKAKLAAARELFNACANSVPDGIVICLRDLPQEIAQLETRAAQLKANAGLAATAGLDEVAALTSNAGVTGAELAHLRETVAVLRERLLAAEEVICSTKRERDCVTTEDWKRKAMYYEYQWRSCSEFANRRIGELTSNVEFSSGAESPEFKGENRGSDP